MQTVTTLLEATALALVLLAAVLVWVPSSYVVPAALVVAAVGALTTSFGLSRVPPKADQ